MTDNVTSLTEKQLHEKWVTFDSALRRAFATSILITSATIPTERGRIYEASLNSYAGVR